jgi:hypothetical protein
MREMNTTRDTDPAFPKREVRQKDAWGGRKMRRKN